MRIIALTQGQVTMVDDSDYAWLNQWKWRAQKVNNGYHAVRGFRENGKLIIQSMHRLILGLTDTLVLGDHKDHNSLNNQRHNLREARGGDNNHNIRKHSTNTSGYKGVGWYKTHQKFHTQIMNNKKKIHLGFFDCPIQAAKMYDFWARDLHGEFANCNFPGKRVGIRKIVVNND